jgi:hypothetical protein
MNVPVNLVSGEYYKEEIAYQQVIDGTKNANGLSTHPQVIQTSSDIIIQLPAEMKNQAVTGSVVFYNAASAGKDKTFNLQPGVNAQQVITGAGVKPGKYIVRTDWWANKVHYHNEQPVTVL